MKRILFASAALAAILLPLGASASTVIIDEFDVSSPLINVSSPGTTYQKEAAPVIGGYRGVEVQRTSGSSSAVNAFIDLSGGGQLDFASGPGISGNTYIYYLGASDSTPGWATPVDMTSSGTQTGIIMQFTFQDHPSSVIVTAHSVGGGVGTDTESAFPFPNQVYFPFTDMPTVNWTQVSYLTFEIVGGIANDYTIQFIETRQGPPVPDTTGTLALLTIAFSLLGVARLKMKS